MSVNLFRASIAFPLTKLQHARRWSTISVDGVVCSAKSHVARFLEFAPRLVSGLNVDFLSSSRLRLLMIGRLDNRKHE